MRLLYLATEPLDIGGVQSDLLALTEDLSALGHDIYVATRPGVLLSSLLACGAKFEEIDFHFRDPWSFIRAAAQLRRIVQENSIDIIAPQSIRTTLTAWYATRFNRSGTRSIPIITTIHNVHNQRHFRYVGYLLKLTSDFVIFESQYECARARAAGLPERQSIVVHSGVDLELYSQRLHRPDSLQCAGSISDEHFVFGIVARISAEKGHAHLIEAFAQVHALVPSTRLVIVGDGPLFGNVHQQVTQLGLEGAVFFAGRQRNIAEWLNTFDVFVLSSTRESFPLAAREAMAAGLSVIAPNIGGCPEVVQDGVTGLLFEAGNTDELRDRMLHIMQNDRARTYGYAAQKRAVEKFSRKDWTNQNAAIYERWHAGSCIL